MENLDSSRSLSESRVGLEVAKLPILDQLEFVKTVLEGMNEVQKGEKGTFDEKGFHPTGGGGLRGARRILPRFVASGAQKLLRKVGGQNCQELVKNIEAVKEKIIGVLNQSLQYLTEQAKRPNNQIDETLRQISVIILNLDLTSLSLAEDGLIRLASNYKIEVDKSRVLGEKTTFVNDIHAKLNAIKLAIPNLQPRQQFLSQRIPPSGIFLLDGKPKCLAIINFPQKTIVIPNNLEAQTQQFFDEMRRSSVSLSVKLNEFPEKVINEMKMEPRQEKGSFKMYTIVDAEELFGNNVGGRSIEINGSMYSLHDPILFANSEYLKEHEAQSKIQLDIPGVKDYRNTVLALHSFYSLKPLQITKDTIQDYVRIGVFLKSPGILKQCREAYAAHPDWYPPMDLFFNQEISPLGFFSFDGHKEALVFQQRDPRDFRVVNQTKQLFELMKKGYESGCHDPILLMYDALDQLSEQAKTGVYFLQQPALLFNDELSSDVIFSFNGTSYRLHEFLLASESPKLQRELSQLKRGEKLMPSHFASIFQDNEEESIRKAKFLDLNLTFPDLTLSHIANPLIEKVLKFLYTQEPPEIKKSEMRYLFRIATFLESPSLLRLCEEVYALHPEENYKAFGENRKFLDQSIPPSGIMEIEGERYWLLLLRPDDRAVLPEKSQELASKFLQSIKASSVCMSKNLPWVISEGLKRFNKKLDAGQLVLKNIQTLFNDKEVSDWTVKVNGKEFYLHKGVFAEMCKSFPTAINDVQDTEVVSFVLQSFYTREPLQINANNIEDIVHIAIALRSEPLLKQCRDACTANRDLYDSLDTPDQVIVYGPAA